MWNRSVSPKTKPGKLEVEVAHPKKSILQRFSDYVPILISVLALAATIVAQWQMIHHNRLSVRPHMSFLMEDNFAAPNVGLFIENDGLGPARIERLSVYFDGHPVSPRDMDSIYTKTRLIFKETSPQWYTSEYTFNVKSGERVGVFFSTPSNIKNVAAFQKLIDERIFVIGEACSLYDECDYFCLRVSNEECLEEEKRIGLPAAATPHKGIRVSNSDRRLR